MLGRFNILALRGSIVDNLQTRDRRSADVYVAQGCRLMRIFRSSFYGQPPDRPDDKKIVGEIRQSLTSSGPTTIVG